MSGDPLQRAATGGDARISLQEHAAAKGAELRDKYGPVIGWSGLCRILEDREIVRYPCRIEFTAEGLDPGEFAFPEPLCRFAERLGGRQA